MQIKKLTNDLFYMIRSMVTKDVYMHLVNNEADVLCAWELDKVKRRLEPIGTLVYSSSYYSYDDKNSEIFIESLFVDEAFRRCGVGRGLLNEMENIVVGMNGISGLSVNIPIPELENEASLFISNGYEHRLDGNVIYKINAMDVSNIPFFAKIKRYRKRYNVLPFNSVTKQELNKLYGLFDVKLPEWLNPSTYGGVLQNDLSFMVIQDDRVGGFFASSLYPDDELYIGGIYVDNKDGMMVAALLSEFFYSLSKRTDIKTIIFAAATEEGNNLAKHIFRDYDGKYDVQVISNFYKNLLIENK
ncbi:MAG: GNAT family N-acetyltransferase [Lachnospiraceae bacterium]|nr:GNAT family N-acetyltransferase [Lachnospiraceae bacterium]